MTGYLQLQSADWLKGAATAVVAALVFALAGLMSTPGFDLFAADWNSILKMALNAAVAAFVGYIGKGLGTNSKGEVLGMKATKPRD